MKIKIVLILSIFLYPQLTTQDDVDIKNRVMCNIAGNVWKSTYVFNIDELPERCDIFSVGQYAFDRNYGANFQMLKSDKDILRAFIDANIPVYTCLGFENTYTTDWKTIFDPSDENTFQTKVFGPLVNFLNEFKMNGLLFSFGDLYTTGVDDLATKLSCFASALKEKFDELVVGMIFHGKSHTSFTDKTLFDFSITNKVLDIYIISWLNLNDCNNDTVKTGVSPITSTDKTIVTIEQITSSVTNSCMDKSKICAMIQMFPNIPIPLLPDYATHSITTYSIYCSSSDKCNSSQWCTSPAQLIYDEGEYAKKFYAGIALEQLDTDDYECTCECGKFPVANIAIDGWTSSPFKDCPALNKN